MGGATTTIITTTITTVTTAIRIVPVPGTRSQIAVLLRFYSSRAFAFAARRRWRYVPSNTVSVSEVQVESAARAGRLA